MIRRILASAAILLAGCSDPSAPASPPEGPPSGARELAFSHTQTFKVYERDGYRIVDLKAPVISWGSEAKGQDQTARVVLAPKDMDPPALEGDLAGATLIRTPVERIAVNYATLEAMLTELGAEDRLVAVGGVKSYNDTIRVRARSGELAQVGYGWHAPPLIDPLVGASPDLFLMVLGDLGHAEHYERIRSLGVPVVPVFFESEPHYMGPVDYVGLLGLMTGKEAEASEFIQMVEGNVDALKARAATQPKKRVLSAWFAGSGRWMVTARNLENALLEDANAENLMREPDNPRLDATQRMGTETLLERAREADCWILRDSHSVAFADKSVLSNFRAWREGCVFASDGLYKADADAFDIYETGVIRPDLLLADLTRMLHPGLRDAPFVYIQPDTKTPQP
ncbi:hypothetical protein BBF93_06820 [Hyphomonas sp. CACIAM 19H1]|uniref:ABC transporter substrate-binding protein n=1 Tax=Hyphomonas sp. CACIAM 19H1 TaxID=1873716 RepID=UPI000DEE02F7|nr:ABC transporter substrate-binding protein [Hyphomonas sp. CACIAM 19H1]AXE63964.1 hypothetical protein BBF93_06820 [Hyphomonas sp. CACIAM 19H1]